MRNRDGSLLLSINGDTIMRDSSEDGEHQVEIRKIDEDRYIYSNYLKKCEALGAYVYEKKGGVTNCYLTERDDSTRIMLISYTYTDDFRILKRQSFEEVYYLLKKFSQSVDIKYGANMSVTEGFGYNAYNNQQSSHALTVYHGTAVNGSVSYAHNDLG